MPEKRKLEKSVADSTDRATNAEQARRIKEELEKMLLDDYAKQREKNKNQPDLKAEREEAKRLRALEKAGDPWKEIDDIIKQFKTEDMAGYNNWALGMMTIFHKIVKIGMLVKKDPIVWSKVIKRLSNTFLPSEREYQRNYFGSSLVLFVRDIPEKVLNYFEVDRNIDSFFLDENELSTISFCAKLDDNGVLHSHAALENGEVLSNDPASPISIMRKYVDAGIIDWAANHGYTQDPACRDGIRFVNQQGQPMSNDEFRRLSHSTNPDENLQQFFKSQLSINVEQLDNMEIDEEPSPAPGGMTP